MMTAAGDCRRDGPFSGEGFLQGRRARGLDVAPKEGVPTGREVSRVPGGEVAGYLMN